MYTIVRDIIVDKKFVKQFFCTDEEWHTNGTTAMEFKTKRDAKLFYLDRPIFFVDNRRTYTQGRLGGLIPMGDIAYRTEKSKIRG